MDHSCVRSIMTEEENIFRVMDDLLGHAIVYFFFLIKTKHTRRHFIMLRGVPSNHGLLLVRASPLVQ